MLSDLKDAIVHFITHRLFALTIIFGILMAILVYRLFDLQILNGQNYLDNFTNMSEKTITTKGQRGNIYDCNGNLLAYNKLTYSLTYTNSDEIAEIAKKRSVQEKRDVSEDEVKNEIIYKLLTILKNNNDKLVNTFDIKRNKKGKYVFSSTNENTILLFKKEVYCATTVEKLTREQKDADAEQVLDYMKSEKCFDVADSYSEEDALNIVAVRYMLFLNRYKEYVPVTVAMDISDKSVASIKEDSNNLLGADIETSSIREYNYSPYFSQILGYTGIISETEKKELNDKKVNKKNKQNQYVGNEIIGKTGLEQEYESVLRGQNGTKTVLVDSVGKIIQTNNDEVAATTGNDLYLTLDAELEKKCYSIVEKYLAGIILTHFQNTTNKRTSAPINITTTDVYFALFDNNIVSMEKLKENSASSNEKQIYATIKDAEKTKIASIRNELLNKRTVQTSLSKENQKYMSYIYKMLCDNGIIRKSDIDSNDEVFQKWNNDKNSLGEFLEYACHKSWIDNSHFKLSDNYYDTEEMLNALMDYIKSELLDDDEFAKMVLRQLIDDGTVSGKQCCMVLYDQGILDKKKDADYDSLSSGIMSAYSFMYQKIKKLEITPAQLALDPCSASVVITDVKTGKVKALVSYPSYDNNRLANNLDDDYYASLLSDKTSPFLNRATQSSTAPGSTFKMISATAGLMEGIITPTSTITCKGIFDKDVSHPKCWVYPSSHGKLNVAGGIEHSCNVFFYEVGYELATRSSTDYDDEYGLARLKKYASLYGLNETSGIELDENKPNISNQDSIRSAIGQGRHSYTPSQLARYVNTIANKGTCKKLSILDKQTDSKGETVKEYQKKNKEGFNMDSTYWDSIYKGMYQVVHGKDHGQIFKSLYTPVAGKTGTAEEDTTRPAHALFVSFAPYDNPEISMAVVVPYGYSSSNAMEIAKDVYAYYFSAEEKAAKKKDKNAKNDKKKDSEEAVIPTSSNARID